MSIRVLIADDQPAVPAGFALLLEAEPDIEVVGEAEDGAQAVALARRRGADVVLMDVRMPRMDGIEATRQLVGQRRRDPVDVLVLTTFDLDEYVFGALRAGAAGFLLKDAEPDGVVDAIRTVAARRRPDRARGHPPADRPLRRQLPAPTRTRPAARRR